MIRQIKNSSGKTVGTCLFFESKIVVNNSKKPELIISDLEILDASKNEREDPIVIKRLYDEFLLSVGEVAAVMGIGYTRANRWFKELPLKTFRKQGRRSSSFGKTFPKERKEKMVTNRKDDHLQLKNVPKTTEQKEKISNTLKKRYATGSLIQNPEPHKKNWLNGIYSKVDFGHGIAGTLFSQKNNKRILFRSLLELFYMLKLEEDVSVVEYKYEPIKIKCEDGTVYTPDLMVGKTLIELKSFKYIQNLKGKVLERFEYKKQQAEKYCKNKRLVYSVVWDKDIGFDSRQMKRELQNNNLLLSKYQIVFFDPKRVGLKATERESGQPRF